MPLTRTRKLLILSKSTTEQPGSEIVLDMEVILCYHIPYIRGWVDLFYSAQ
jgi:hypothetical protein